MNILKKNIELFLPAIPELLGDSDIDWEKIDKKFTQLIKRRIDSKTIKVEATIYDHIIQVKKKDANSPGSARYLDFINAMIRDLTAIMSLNQRKMIKEIIRNLLISFDLKHVDYLGEIGVLHNFTKNGRLKLLQIEYPVSNGKNIDFCFHDTVLSEALLVFGPF